MEARDEELDGQPVHWLEAPGDEPPVLYLHGVPTASWDWEPFLERTGGIAPDLPGFGRSGKRADLPYTMGFYGEWVERFLEWRGIEQVRLVVHDWGVVGLLWAMRHPERVGRLVVMDGVPLLPGYRWHRLARAWRAPGVGQVLMGGVNRPATNLILREAKGGPGPMPEAFLDRVMEGFDQGTQRAILRLYRSAPEDELARAGEALSALTCPALVVWGEQDPYIPPEFADRYAEALGAPAEVVRLPDAGHWPWIDRPDVVDSVTTFLSS